ncbi:MAG: hypothetical protein JSW64_03480 [Candidatus Zixiibacteriota bacterium]|nr:MAG: hypothetical protein JSW64_03480 [candidate division Zixibacteria bacterium]
MKALIYTITLITAALMLVTGCDKKAVNSINENLYDESLTSGETVSTPDMANPAAPPADLVTVDIGGQSVEFWPWAGSDLSGTPWDPASLIFAGEANPAALRAALMFLDGDRTAYGFPDAYPFNATWRDAMGDVQATYGTPAGWVGNVIQMECGAFDPIRIHLRLFDMGDWTMGTAHFEILIPGTTDHQVISWELAEQLVVVDLLRSGLLDETVPMFPTQQINDAPTWREIPPYIYNELPVELRAAIGGPLGDVTDPVGIGNNGYATVLNITTNFGWSPEVARQELTVNFNQVIPKPFCAGGQYQYVYVTGPVDLNQTVQVLPNGNITSRFRAHGRLDITPVDPSTTPPTPIGETYRAVVSERHRGIVTNGVTLISSFRMQMEIPPSGPFHGRLVSWMEIGPNGHSGYELEIECAD